MESTWKLREFPVSKEDLESMKHSLERLNFRNDTYAVMSANTKLIHRKLHHCTVCNVILNSCTQTRDHCNGRKHLSRLKLYGKESSFGPKGENVHTSPVNSSGIVSLKSNDMSLKDANSRNTVAVTIVVPVVEIELQDLLADLCQILFLFDFEGSTQDGDLEEVSPTCPPTVYHKVAQTATSTPKTSLSILVESNHKTASSHLDTEEGRRKILQELNDTFTDSLNDAVNKNIVGPSATKKPSTKKVVARCNICNLEFSGMVILQSHLSGVKHAKKVKSLEILRELESRNEFIIKDETSQFHKCEVCDAVVSSTQQLQMHLRGVNMTGGGDGPGVGCFSTVSRDNIAHFGDCQAKQNILKEGFKYMCAVCKVSLNSEIQLQQHLNSKKHKEAMTKVRTDNMKTYAYGNDNERASPFTQLYQKRSPKQHGMSYWFAQQQKLRHLNLGHTSPSQYMYRGNSTSIIGQRTMTSSMPDYYAHRRYVI